MLRADGRDIVKRSSTRKNRYLLVFNMRLAPAAAGKLVREARVGGSTAPPAPSRWALHLTTNKLFVL